MTEKLNPKTIAAWVQMFKTQRLLLAQVEADFKAAGLPPLSWYDVLYELECAESKDLRQYELSEQIILSKHNLSRLLDRLQKKGLIKRGPCRVDGRGNCVLITEKGKKVLKNMWPVYARAIKTYFSDRLDNKDIAHLSSILLKLTEEKEGGGDFTL